MPTRRELYQEMAARHEREHRADTRAQRRFWIKTAAWCWVWAIVGLVFGAWAFRTNDVELGRIFLLTGQLVTLVGVLGTVAYALVLAARRGWR